MPWVATDMNGKVFVFKNEPEKNKDGSQFVDPTTEFEYGICFCPDFPNSPGVGEKREFKWSDFVASDATERVNKDIDRMVFRDILRELVSVQDGAYSQSYLNSVTERAHKALASYPQTENEKIAKQIVDTQKQSEKMCCGRCGSTALTLEVFNFGKRFSCQNCFAIFGYNDKPDELPKKEPPGAVALVVMQEEIRERLQPAPIVREISLSEFSDEERPVPASKLADIFTQAACELWTNELSSEALLEFIAERIRDAAGLPKVKP